MYNLLGPTSKNLSGNIEVLIDLINKTLVSICNYNYDVWRVSVFTKDFSPCDFISKLQKE